MKFGVVIFPGSNCEQDVVHAVHHLGHDASYVWHQDTDLSGFDAVVLPGGFSYGDYLRCGAVARFSPVMAEVKRYADSGRPVLGICNGFQILTEAHMLEGALLRNSGLKFICKSVPLRVEAQCDWLDLPTGKVIHVPMNHGEGNYVCDADTLDRLRENDQVILRYCDERGGDLEQAPNGALDNIAGICNVQRNVMGLMPHPERVTDPAGGGTDGAAFFQAAIRKLSEVAS